MPVCTRLPTFKGGAISLLPASKDNKGVFVRCVAAGVQRTPSAPLGRHFVRKCLRINYPEGTCLPFKLTHSRWHSGDTNTLPGTLKCHSDSFAGLLMNPILSCLSLKCDSCSPQTFIFYSSLVRTPAVVSAKPFAFGERTFKNLTAIGCYFQRSEEPQQFRFSLRNER